MTLEQLRIFVAVAECQHVTAAAKTLHLTQSAVSAAIRALETRHDVALFDRVGRQIVLTEAGRMFLAEARAVLDQAATAEASLADLTGLRHGRLILAASQTVGNYWLPERLARFGRAYPGIRLSLAIGNSEQVRGWLREGTAELGFVEDAHVDAELTKVAVAEDSLTVVAAPSLITNSAKALSGGDPAGPEGLRALPWVFRERGSGTRTIFEAALDRIAVAPADLNMVLELPTNEAVRAAAISGAGAAALSCLVVQNALASGALIALPFSLPKRRFFLLYHPARARTHAARAFIAQLTDLPLRAR